VGAQVIELSRAQVSSRHEALFERDRPLGLRSVGVLRGLCRGRLLSDALDDPSWFAVWEPGDGVLYPYGAVDLSVMQILIGRLRRAGELLVAAWSADDPIVGSLPGDPAWEGESIDFEDRSHDADRLEKLRRCAPPESEVVPIDQRLLARCAKHGDVVRRHGSEEAFLRDGLGFCLMQRREILCEAYAGPAIDGVRELGVVTREDVRGRGLATATCARLVEACETEGHRVFWNASTGNQPSVALARRLGFRQERAFRWWCWPPAE